MKKLVIGVFVVVALAGITVSAQAYTDGTLSVVWNNVNTAYYNWSLNGGVTWVGKAVNNGWATGTFDPVGSNPVRDLGKIWCVDLFNYSNYPWSATQWTDADGAGSLAAWLAPPGDDGLRSATGLNQASFLAYKYGNAVGNDVTKKLTLQMAMWTAAYGTTRFQWTGGGGVDAALLGTMVADIPLGTNFARNEWYDNDDPDAYYQDFMNDVPEPSSLLLLGGVLFGAAALGWRKRK